MYKEDISAIESTIAATERDYTKGMITRIEYVNALQRHTLYRAEILSAAYDAGELDWCVDPEQALQYSYDQFKAVNDSYDKGFNDAMTRTAAANKELKFP